MRVNAVLCVYVSVQGVRERRECDRQRENTREGRVRLACCCLVCSDLLCSVKRKSDRGDKESRK